MVVSENKWRVCNHAVPGCRYYKMEDDTELDGTDFLALVWNDVRCGNCGAKICIEEMGYYHSKTGITRIIVRAH